MPGAARERSLFMNKIIIPVKVTTKIFRDFALFDNLNRKKRWLSPAVFTGILMLSAAICFLMKERAEQAVLLGGVLTGVAVIVPTVYFATFFHSITLQANAMKLRTPRLAYTVELGDTLEGIRITAPRESSSPMAYAWKDIYMAYRRRGCIYLYVSQNQAFLLPDGQAENNVSPQEVWDRIAKQVPTERLS